MEEKEGVQVIDSNTQPDEVKEKSPGTVEPFILSTEERPLEELFQNIVNWRDVGYNCNVDSNKNIIKPLTLFRSGRLDDASTADLNVLTEKYNIKCIIDLRSETEGRMGDDLVNTFPAAVIREQLSRHHHHRHHDDDTKEEEVSRHHRVHRKKSIVADRVSYFINFAGTSFRYHAVWKPLTFRQKAETLYLYGTGKKAEAVTFIGKNVIQPHGLIGLNKNFVDYCGSEIVSALKLMSHPKAWPMLVHCTQGKDRTGLVIALALSLCGVSDDAIALDYARSQEGLNRQRHIMIEEMRKTGLEPEFSDATAEVIRMTFEYIRKNYKSIPDYLKDNGLTNTDIEAIRRNLLHPDQTT